MDGTCLSIGGFFHFRSFFSGQSHRYEYLLRFFFFPKLSKKDEEWGDTFHHALESDRGTKPNLRAIELVPAKGTGMPHFITVRDCPVRCTKMSLSRIYLPTVPRRLRSTRRG